VTVGKKLWTEEELQAFPDDGFDHEVSARIRLRRF
jgi:hypothetical protein